ncbi:MULTISPECIES: sensor histidine kinase [Stappiaceae]|uniref:histidine kinase n=2 Tax=Roseibium TaxID=150830 RepID=A0A0M6Y7G2_9HYPH|nr:MULTISPECIES: HAMP domain-containing sensor histidine kinase [Roseibium]MBO9458183.1 HAMP domain-containing histidine kinase [Labrenzia sp. R5_0]MCR9280244.1 HAMP domain-containing histidine kinase [Paracoccaceae bacterium]AQQ02701.1 two-component sensor histidine kinase [Roseibium aggregatum]MBO6856844.1 HAMP domain-containing histidine kinase [Roseibium sp.]UES36527.1 HAMP domain-containing protein [Roseibium aggregatum]
MTRLTRFTRTTAFKLSLLYIAVFTVMSGVLLFYIADNTDNLMSEQVVQSVDSELKTLADVYVRGGVRDLVETIDRRSRHPDASLYLLVDFAGNALVGNIARLPTTVLEEADGGLRRVRYTRLGQDAEDVERQAMVRTFELRGGFRLLVGRDLGDQLRFSNLLANALRLWLVVVVVMAAITWLFVSRRVMKRIDEISATSRTIMQGELSGRLPVAGNDDEFDRLAINLNTMLDRIELLMQSMKDVTDNIAHDLKTPLTRLQTRIENALREAKGEEGYRGALEATLEESDQLLRIFNALLRIARVESMAPASVMEPTDLNKLVAEVAELYEPLVEDEGGKLETDLPEGLKADCNRDLISQVLVNLIENALKYGRPETGDLLIRLGGREEDGRIVLSVTDNGPGIPEKDQDRVKERFVRLEESRSEPGTGLGLSLVKAVARLHGGDLRFMNEDPGLSARIDLKPVKPDSSRSGHEQGGTAGQTGEGN